jgi:indole-3-glycerol phosphate synthase
MSILERILVAKRDEVAWARSERPLAEVDAVARVAPSPRGFEAALRRPQGAPLRVIAEIKRASPSAGPIRPGADPAAIASDYEAGGAAGISVLTDRSFFDGDLAFLPPVRAAASLPLLRKDFIIDAYQLAEARAAGADAVLLIVAALPGDQLGELHAAAKAYELDVLVEVHDARELERALAAGATLVGVNHRDLRTFEIDMSLTRKLAREVPSQVTLVAESGIRRTADARQLAADGAHAILVGEQLMRADSPREALRALTSELAEPW